MVYLNYLNPSFGTVIIQVVLAALITAVYILLGHIDGFKKKISKAMRSNEG
jgi:hypothetical protein